MIVPDFHYHSEGETIPSHGEGAVFFLKRFTSFTNSLNHVGRIISLALKPIKVGFVAVLLWMLLFGLDIQIKVGNTGYKIQLPSSENSKSSETRKLNHSRV